MDYQIFVEKGLLVSTYYFDILGFAKGWKNLRNQSNSNRENLSGEKLILIAGVQVYWDLIKSDPVITMKKMLLLEFLEDLQV